MLLLMKSQHYIYRSKPLPQQLLDNAASLKTKVAQYSDERMLNELERLMFYMHDGHSYILPVATKVQAFFLPVQFCRQGHYKTVVWHLYLLHSDQVGYMF